MAAGEKALHVVLGASGGAGLALVQELEALGHRVRAVSRTTRAAAHLGPQVEVVAADLTDPEAARSACAGAAAVYHCANVPYPEWAEVLPRLAENALAGAEAAGARLVVADNLYMYGPPDGPLTEDTPRRPHGAKGRLRTRLEELFLNAHAKGRAPVAIGRASDFYGPNTNALTSLFVFAPLMGDGTPSWLGRLDAPHSLTYIEDFARGLAVLGAREVALGQIWHIPSGPPVTGRDFITAVCREAGRAVRMRTLAKWMLYAAAPFDRMARESLEIVYQFDRPFVMDATKFERAFGGRVTPLPEGIRRALAWYRARGA